MDSLFTTAGMEFVKTFRKLTPYDIDFMCEKIYTAIEENVYNKGKTKTPSLPFTLADYKHLHLKGMRNYFVDMITAQKTSFDHYIEAMRCSSYIERELSAEEIEKHHQMFAYPHEERGTKKAPVSSSAGV